jgi:HK97 family phage portal protein
MFERFRKRFFSVTERQDSDVVMKIISMGNDLHVGIVTPETAKAISTLNACVRLIIETKSLVRPKIYIYKDGVKKIDNDHDQNSLLTRKANKFTTSIDWEMQWVADYLYWGNGFAKIVRNEKGRPINFINLDPSKVEFVKIDGKPYYKYAGGQPIAYENMLHLSDLKNGKDLAKSRISESSGTFSDILLANSYSKSMYKSGLKMIGYIVPDRPITPEAAKVVRDTFISKHENGEVGVLPNGFEFKQLNYALPFGDAQVIEAKNLGKKEIAEIYRVPLSLLSMGDHADNKGEADFNKFLAITIAPLCLKMEAEFDSKIFKTTELDRSVKYELKGLYRTSMQERYNAHRVAIFSGFMSPDEVRHVEGMPPLPNGLGTDTWRPLNSVPADKWDDYLDNKKGNNATKAI